MPLRHLHLRIALRSMRGMTAHWWEEVTVVRSGWRSGGRQDSGVDVDEPELNDLMPPPIPVVLPKVIKATLKLGNEVANLWRTERKIK